ncbi:hypothetical protein BT96DRAFT_930146 [Gymnopus androsaceus JB14]|uniref:Uncharacterized protein n=1 Tax=Gymnopus androsaceus JB14 TaxID=1447944 RepID=A0A6A4GBQ4_9AGAR|nr:hypothetical protein BT96DRAFT_930146 [Gymnopus androsaceus JB14]
MSQQSREIGILAVVQLVTVFLSSVFWGISLITFVQSIRCLLWDSKGIRKPSSTISWSMLIAAVLLALFPVIDVATSLKLNIEALQSFTVGSAAGLLDLATADWVVLKTCIIFLGKLVSDGAWVYRCWVIYNRRWFIIAVPLFLWLAYLSLTIYIIIIFAGVQSAVVQFLFFIATGFETSLVQQLFPAIISGWVISLVSNLLTSGLIVHRIRMVDMYTQDVTGSRKGIRIHIYSLFSRQRHEKTTRLQNINAVIIESGLLHTTFGLIVFSTFLASSLSFFPMCAVEIQVLSIAFNLVIIRGARQNDDVQSSMGFQLHNSAVNAEDAAEESRGREMS